MTPDGRLLGVTVAGAHTNVGDGYHLNGLGIRSGNLMVDYLNALSDTPYLQKRAEPSDPAMNVVHRSDYGFGGLMRIGASDPGDSRRTVETMAPRGVKGDRENAEPVDTSLKASMDHRIMPITAPPSEKAPLDQTKLDPTHAGHPDFKLHQQSSDAVRKLDESMGRNTDVNSDRMAASLTVLARQEGIQRIDNVVLSHGNDIVKAGENVIVVQGKLEDPSHTRAYMSTHQAVNTPVTESFKQLDTLNAQPRQELAQQQSLQPVRDNVSATQQLQEQEVQRQTISR